MRIEANPATWNRWKSAFPTDEDLGLSTKDVEVSKLLGVRVDIDPSLPDNEIRIVSGNQSLRIINLGVND